MNNFKRLFFASLICFGASLHADIFTIADVAEPDVPAILALLEAGQDVNAHREGSGDTLVHIAARHGNLQLIRELYYRGARLFEVNDDGLLPLGVAQRLNVVDVELLHFLDFPQADDANEIIPVADEVAVGYRGACAGLAFPSLVNVCFDTIVERVLEPRVPRWLSLAPQLMRTQFCRDFLVRLSEAIIANPDYASRQLIIGWISKFMAERYRALQGAYPEEALALIKVDIALLLQPLTAHVKPKSPQRRQLIEFMTYFWPGLPQELIALTLPHFKVHREVDAADQEVLIHALRKNDVVTVGALLRHARFKQRLGGALKDDISYSSEMIALLLTCDELEPTHIKKLLIDCVGRHRVRHQFYNNLDDAPFIARTRLLLGDRRVTAEAITEAARGAFGVVGLLLVQDARADVNELLLQLDFEGRTRIEVLQELVSDPRVTLSTLLKARAQYKQDQEERRWRKGDCKYCGVIFNCGFYGCYTWKFEDAISELSWGIYKKIAPVVLIATLTGVSTLL